MFPEIPFRIPGLIVLGLFAILTGLILLFGLSWWYLIIAPVVGLVLFLALVVFIASFTRWT